MIDDVFISFPLVRFKLDNPFDIDKKTCRYHNEDTRVNNYFCVAFSYVAIIYIPCWQSYSRMICMRKKVYIFADTFLSIFFVMIF